MAQPPDEGVIPRDPSVWNYSEPTDVEPDIEPQEPATPPGTTVAPYDTIDVALDGWTYRLWRQWLGEDEQEQRKNVDLLTDIFQQYDPSATSLLEMSKSQPDSPDPYSWVFRFGLFGDPAKVTEAIENLDSQLLKIAKNFKVMPGTAKALVTRMDGTEEAVELPKDMVSSDIATTAYRLLDLVQMGGVKSSPETESRTSELRQITSPASGEFCSAHQKTGEEHTDEEREQDILGAKGEEELWGKPQPLGAWKHQTTCPYGCGMVYSDELSIEEFQNHLLTKHTDTPEAKQLAKEKGIELPKAKTPTQSPTQPPVQTPIQPTQSPDSMPIVPRGTSTSKPLGTTITQPLDTTTTPINDGSEDVSRDPYLTEEAHGHPCSECGTEMNPVNEAHTEYRCPNWKGECSQADSGVRAIECDKCYKNWSKSEDEEPCQKHNKEWKDHDFDEAMEDMTREIGKLEEGQAWLPDYQAVPKALKSEPIEYKPEPQQPDWSRWRKDVDTYSTEMSNLIDTVLKIGDDQTGTPEAIEKTAKVAGDRMKEIVDWATELLEKVTETMETSPNLGPDSEYIIDNLQNMIDYGNRFQMLLIQSQEKAKTMSIPQ